MAKTALINTNIPQSTSSFQLQNMSFIGITSKTGNTIVNFLFFPEKPV